MLFGGSHGINGWFELGLPSYHSAIGSPQKLAETENPKRLDWI